MNFWFYTSVKMPNLSFLDNPYLAIIYQVFHWHQVTRRMSLGIVTTHHLALVKVDYDEPVVYTAAHSSSLSGYARDRDRLWSLSTSPQP